MTHGDQQATVVEVGGGIRSYDVGGRPVLQSYPREAICDGAHGQPLVPWPNRIGDGRYSFDGSDYRLALTEPDKHNAIHGLLRWVPWAPLEHTPDRVVLGARLHPRPGYPFSLDVHVAYQLGASGLVVRTTATNVGDRACPYGSGQHPYLSPGAGLIDACRLEFDAGTRIRTDEDRQLPTGTAPVLGTEFDFSTPRPIGATAIDHAFTELDRDGDGRSWVRLTGPDEHSVELWLDDGYPYVELYTADTLRPERRRRGLAVEPMTCPPNAFQTGDSVIRLEPGATTTATWGVRLA